LRFRLLLSSRKRFFLLCLVLSRNLLDVRVQVEAELLQLVDVLDEISHIFALQEPILVGIECFEQRYHLVEGGWRSLGDILARIQVGMLHEELYRLLNRPLLLEF